MWGVGAPLPRRGGLIQLDEYLGNNPVDTVRLPGTDNAPWSSIETTILRLAKVIGLVVIQGEP